MILWALLGILGLGAFAMKNDKTPSANLDPYYRWDDLIKKYSSKYNVPWRWMKAIMMNESNLGRAPSVARGLKNPLDIEASKSSDGKSWGLMQLTLPTARQFESTVTESALNDPEISVRLGAKYLNYLIKLKTIRNREAVIRSYNGGPGYLQTVAGVRDTPKYYSKFLENLNYIMNVQPGDELET